MSKIKTAMIGGGIGGFIGEIHRMAMRLDDRYDLVAGALSSDAIRAIESADALGIRGYASWQELLEKETENVDCIVIVTPNDSHAELSIAALQAGYNVILDKPMTRSLDEATRLKECVETCGCMFAMTYTYTGYPMVRQMRERILAGDIGDIRTVSVDYRQGWLANPIEQEGQKQATWRTDPTKSGAGALGDIGSHAEQLARFTTNCEITHVRGDVYTLVDGRLVDDHASVQLKLTNGVIGDLVCSQVCTGERNHVSIRVWGTDGSLSWSHQQCDELKFTAPDGTETNSFCEVNRAPSGHPAGFIEAFANIYKDCSDKMQGRDVEIVGVDDGFASMKFIESVLKSEESQSWVAL